MDEKWVSRLIETGNCIGEVNVNGTKHIIVINNSSVSIYKDSELIAKRNSERIAYRYTLEDMYLESFSEFRVDFTLRSRMIEEMNKTQGRIIDIAAAARRNGIWEEVGFNNRYTLNIKGIEVGVIVEDHEAVVNVIIKKEQGYASRTYDFKELFDGRLGGQEDYIIQQNLAVKGNRIIIRYEVGSEKEKLYADKEYEVISMGGKHERVKDIDDYGLTWEERSCKRYGINWIIKG
jgi:hypothetical protein